MTSRHLDPEQAKRHAEHRLDFNRKGLGGRVVLLPGGAGGIGAAPPAANWHWSSPSAPRIFLRTMPRRIGIFSSRLSFSGGIFANTPWPETEAITSL